MARDEPPAAERDDVTIDAASDQPLGAALERSWGIDRLLLAALALIALLAGLDVTQNVAAPVLLGIVLSIVAAPLTDRLHRIGVPDVATAAGILITVLTVVVLLILSLGPVVEALIRRIPTIQAELRNILDTLSRVLSGIDAISSQLEQTVGEPAGIEAEAGDALPSVADALWLAPNIGGQALIFAGALFFFTLTRVRIYEGFHLVTTRLFRAERAVSRYFAVVTLINTGLGVATAVVMTLIGMPGAILWGVAAALMNFVLYLGPLTIAAALLVGAFGTFTGPAVLLPPLAFLALNFTEGQFVTPALVGQNLSLNPLGVFLAIVFGLWLWGPVGAVVALPVVVWIAAMQADAPRLR
jgi:predicted PurR-regulated permease PerM